MGMKIPVLQDRLKAYFFFSIDVSVPLQCHQCSTDTDFNCSDPFYTNASRTVLKTDEYLADCETFDNGTIIHSCQKIVQNISGITSLRYPLKI